LGLNAQTNKSANSILINQLSKYVNIKQQANAKRFQPLASKLRKTGQAQGTARKAAESGEGLNQD